MAKLSIHEIDDACEEENKLQHELDMDADQPFDDSWLDELEPDYDPREDDDMWLFEDDYNPLAGDPYYDSIYHDDDFV